MSLARRHREHTLATQMASAPALVGGLPAAPADFVATPGTTMAAQIAMRLTHDLRRLKETKSIDRKIAVKREVIAEYYPWTDGLLEAGRATNGNALASTGADDVLPTIMVWSIDIGDWLRALALAGHVLRFGIELPARYERDAATLVLEEIAEAALKAQNKGERFPLWVLEAVEQLVDGVDMHDEPRAKLLKAIGFELAQDANDAIGDAGLPLIDRALETLTRAQDLHDRVGVKTKLRELEKARKALSPIATDGIQPPTGVGGGEARPAETSPHSSDGASTDAKAGNDATSQESE